MASSRSTTSRSAGDCTRPAEDAALAKFVPRQRRDLVAVEAIKHPSRLLRGKQPGIHLTRLADGLRDGALRIAIHPK